MDGSPADVKKEVIAACQACNAETGWDISLIDDLIQKGYDINLSLGHVGDILR